jgi:hypothetical protein
LLLKLPVMLGGGCHRVGCLLSRAKQDLSRTSPMSANDPKQK